MIFGYFQRKREQEEQHKAEILKREAERVAQMKREVAVLTDRAVAQSRINRSEHIKYIEEENSVCPVCSSRKVNNRIKRLEGSLKGSISSHSSSFLFMSNSRSNGRIDGKLDTKPVNVCNECGHEWNIRETSYEGFESGYEQIYGRLRVYLKSYNAYKDCNFDPLDPKEKFFSLEEKREHLRREYDSLSWKEYVNEYFEGMSIDTILFVANDSLSGLEKQWFLEVATEDNLKALGYKKIGE